MKATEKLAKMVSVLFECSAGDEEVVDIRVNKVESTCESPTNP